MKPKEYEKNVLITESNDYDVVIGRIDKSMIRLLHAGLGLSSELAELEEAVLGKSEIDYVNIAEEISDLMWYAAIAINVLGLDVEEVLVCDSEIGYSRDFNKKSPLGLTVAIGAMVMATGVFNDLIKKHLFYGRALERKKMEGALKALSYSMSGACFICDVSPEKVREMNINKLKARYGEKFTEAAALNRDLEAERKILEEGVK